MLDPVIVIQMALDEVSIDSKENPPGSDNNPYGRDIDKNYPSWFNGKKNGHAWCTQFHDDMFIRSYGEAAARKLLNRPEKSLGAVVKYAYNYYKAAGRVGSDPQKGASIFFHNTEGLSHIGIVTNFDANYVWTVEGNTWNDVDKSHYYYVSTHRYKRSSTYIYGYGYPAYDYQPEIHYKRGVTYNVVCSDPLMLRGSAGTSGKIYGELHKGAPVLCDNVAFDEYGNEWIRTGALWCCGHYGQEVYIK